MNKLHLLFIFFVTTLIFSCSNKPSPANIAEENTPLISRDLGIQQKQEMLTSVITQKWVFGDEYLNLKNEGTFEAVLGGKHIQGKWGLTYNTSELKLLKLMGKEDAVDNTAKDFNSTLELIDVSYDRLVAIDTEGHKVSFFPEKD